jgi:hypothetical protein
MRPISKKTNNFAASYHALPYIDDFAIQRPLYHGRVARIHDDALCAIRAKTTTQSCEDECGQRRRSRTRVRENKY